jgi:hypothetical protein
MLSGMGDVVTSNTDDFTRQYRGEQADGHQRLTRILATEFPERIPFDISNGVFENPAITGWNVPGLVANDAHGLFEWHLNAG